MPITTPAPGPTPEPTSGDRVLLASFSRPGENYYYYYAVLPSSLSGSRRRSGSFVRIQSPISRRVRDVVPGVPEPVSRSGIEPDHVDTEPLQVVEMIDHPLRSPIPSAFESANNCGYIS